MSEISKILIVDDKPENLTTMKVTLNELDIEIYTATSGNEALKTILHHQFALLILDVMMPEMDGYELAELIRSQKETQKIPLIFLTAMDSTEKSIFKGYQSGAVDYLFKPVEENILINKISVFVELDQQKNELRRSNKELETFASVASHDLKSPLRNIRNLGRFLKEDYADLLDEEGNSYIEKIDSLVIRMTGMIENILQFSRITKEVKPFELINLNELVIRVLDNLAVPVKETKGTINVGDLPSIMGDKYLLLQLFQNLVANALKFHQKGEPPIIDINAESNGSRFYEITIKDNGIGFNEKDAEKIFLPLKRLVSRDEYEGSGIGLATCQKTVDHHKGKISCRSQPGVGTSFIISLFIRS